MSDPSAKLCFAVYLCPPQDDPFYRLGSELLGHDVRARREMPMPPFVHRSWQREAGPYGLHLTLVEAFFTDPDCLNAIWAETRACAECLSPRADLRLSDGRLDVWRGEVIVWRLDATPDLRLLQTLLAARLAPYATHSPFDDEVAAHPERYPEAYQRARLRLLRTPRGLDTWEPHYTLVQPAPPEQVPALTAHLGPRLAAYREQRVQSLALFVRRAGEPMWHIEDEIGLPVTPAPPV